MERTDLINGLIEENVHVRMIYPDKIIENWFGKKEFEEIKNVFKNNGICIELMN